MTAISALESSVVVRQRGRDVSVPDRDPFAGLPVCAPKPKDRHPGNGLAVEEHLGAVPVSVCSARRRVVVARNDGPFEFSVLATPRLSASLGGGFVVDG